MRPILAAILVCTAMPAYALQHPHPVGDDPHVQVARFDPAEPVLVVGALGRPVTITFGPTEHIRRVNLDAGYIDAAGKTVSAPWNGPDADQMAQQPIGNILPLWAVRAGRSNAQVVTATDDGASRIYQFVLVALPPQPDDCAPAAGQAFEDCDDPRMTAGLSFLYPPERPKPAPVDQAAVQRHIAAVRLAATVAAEGRLKTDIFYGERNWKYLVKGKPQAVKDLAPDQISDNTQVTGLLYLGNRPIPALYVVEPGGAERQVSPEPDKDLLVVGETAYHWRLRKDTEVVDLFNQGLDPIGANPATGTISPNVVRITKK